jgi:hypothetical protein
MSIQLDASISPIAPSPVVLPVTNRRNDVTSMVSVIFVYCGNIDKVGKAFRLDAVDESGTARFNANLSRGAWKADETPTATAGKWESLPTGGFKGHCCLDETVYTLEGWAKLLSSLADGPQRVLIQGWLKDDRRTATPLANGWAVADRSKVHYEDYARRWLIVDVDGLPVDYDVTRASQQDIEQAIDEYLADVMPALAGCSYVVAHRPAIKVVEFSIADQLGQIVLFGNSRG